jgi:lipopolysaccharide export system permease protein
MRLRPLLHDQLVARAVFVSLLQVWIVLVAFSSVLDFASQLDDLGKGGYSIGHVVLYITCTMPWRIYELFPTSALIGSLLGLGGLAGTSELIALRAAGISRSRICVGAVVGLALATVVMMVDAETLGPQGEQAAETISMTAKSDTVGVTSGTGLWARDGNVYLNARAGAKHMHSGVRDVDLAAVRLFELDANGSLLSLVQADRAEYHEKRWILFNVVHTDFAPGREYPHQLPTAVTMRQLPTEEWKSGLKPETVLAGVEKTRYESAKELRRNIDYMHRNKVDASEYENAYWERWIYPLNVLALCLAALPFAFGQLRSGGFGKRLFAGIVCGMTYFLLQRLAQNLATIYHLPLWEAHITPPLLILLVSRWYFRRQV